MKTFNAVDHKAPRPGLGGSTKKATSREDDIAAAKAERAARSDARLRTKAAVSLQSRWRGRAARSAAAAAQASAWLRRFSPLLQDARLPQLTARQVAEELLPPALFVLLPPTARSSGALLHQGVPLDLTLPTAAPAASSSSVPPPALPCPPPTASPSVASPSTTAGDGSRGTAGTSAAAASPSARPAAPSSTSSGGGPTSPPGPLLPSSSSAAASSSSSVLRVLLSLMLRSLSSPAQESNYLALALADSPEAQASWRHQATKLLHVCCATVAATGRGADAVLEAAAVRVLALMTDGAAWKVATDDSSRAASKAASHALLRSFSAHPAPLFAALSRTLGKGRSAPSGPLPPPAPPGAAAVASAPSARVSGTSSAPKLMSLVLSVLDLGRTPAGQEGPGAAKGATAAGGGSGAAPFVTLFVRLVLLAPFAVEQLSDEVKDKLLEPHLLSILCSALRRLAATRGALAGPDALWALANLTQLLASGAAIITTAAAADAAVAAPGTALLAVPQLRLARQMADPAVAVLYTAAAAQLVQVLASSAVTSSSASVGQQRDGGAGPGPYSAAAAGVRGQGIAGVSGGGSTALATATAAAAPAAGTTAAAVSAASAAAVATAVSRLWPLGQRAFLMGLLAGLEGQGSGGVPAFAAFAATLLQALPEYGRRLAAGGQEAAAAALPTMLSTLAFARPLLPKLWAWLSTALGLPREAPLNATRGLDVKSLESGLTGLRPDDAQALGLFCQLYTHLLLVLDDEEFYDLSEPFTLPQARAIGTSLNSLVYHTLLGPNTKTAGAAPGASHPPDPVLAESSPLLLRALYERDVRRNYCQPALWLAPYVAMYGAAEKPSGGVAAVMAALENIPGMGTGATLGAWSAAAVLQSLIFSPAAPEEETRDGGSLQVRAGEGSRPASLAALLRIAPQCVPFAQRVELFRELLREDRARGGWDRPAYEGGAQPIKITIRRASLMEDAFAALSRTGPALKARLIVTFINQAGLSEAGLDYGGLMKELLEEVVARGLTTDYGLFLTTEGSVLAYPNPAAERMDGGLALLEFMGLMVGKALYEGILLSAALAPFFVTRLQGRRPILDDMRTFDPALHRSLHTVKKYAGDVSDLGLDFTVEDHFYGAMAQRELMPGGSDIAVTNDNRLLYCHLLADWHLNIKLGRPAEAFARGLAHLIPITSLRLFNPYEFNELVSGGEGGGLDVDDMRAHVKYSGGYGPDSTSIKLFWKVVSDMDTAHRSALLKFATSCSRAPLGGFRYLQPPLTVHKVDCAASLFAVLGVGSDVERLPSASTCYNMLKLPNYRRAATMRDKLVQAITSGAGFELS